MSTLHYFDADKNGKNISGNPEKTHAVQQLIRISREQRDQQWIADLLQNIDECTLKLGNPEVAIANDGFPYMNAQTLESDKDRGAFVITNEIDRLIQQGFGIVINAGAGHPDWLFSAGDLLNYRLNGEFYTDNSLFSDHGANFDIPADEKILVGHPSVEILPDIARQHIRDFLENVNVKNGKVLLMARNYESNAEATQDLVFNITPKDFSSGKDYQQVMQTIAWFLPRHYSIVGLNEESISNGFEAI